MDLHDIQDHAMYFDEPLSVEVQGLLDQAATEYGAGGGEMALLKAHLLAPEHLTVLVALYRYYYYRHDLGQALTVAGRALAVAGTRLGFPSDWRTLDQQRLAAGIRVSIGLVRFYLLALKGAGFLCCRLGRINEGLAMLRQVVALDAADRLGALALLQVIESALADDVTPSTPPPAGEESAPMRASLRQEMHHG